VTADVLVVGDIAWDTVVRVSAWPERDRDLPSAIGEGAGGQGFNIALWAARAGARSALVTQIGTDARSRELARIARASGVALWAPTRADPLTRVVSIVDPAGLRGLLTHPGPGPLALPRSGWAAGALALSGYLLGRPGGAERVEAWLAWAERRGLPTALDLAHPDVAPAWAPFGGRVTWMFGNEAEWAAYQVAGAGAPRGRVVKRGADGAELDAPEGRCAVPPPGPGPGARDSTGAGDCLMGTFLGRLCLGDAADEALRAAVGAASAVLGLAGATGLAAPPGGRG